MGNKVSKEKYRIFLDEDTQKKTIYGYIRNCQQLLSKNKLHLNIPKSLYYICFMYIFIEFDEWNVDKKYCSK